MIVSFLSSIYRKIYKYEKSNIVFFQYYFCVFLLLWSQTQHLPKGLISIFFFYMKLLASKLKQLKKMKSHQWIVTLWLTRFLTLTSTVSSSLA